MKRNGVAFGLASPINALGRAVAKIAEIQVPAEPRTTFNVGRIGGGTSVNAIAADAWMEVDARSPDEHVPGAGRAAQPEVGSEPVDQPRRTTARMGPLQPDHVPQPEGDRRALSHNGSVSGCGRRQPDGG